MICIAFPFMLAGCESQEGGPTPPSYSPTPPESLAPEFVLGTLPLHNPAKLLEMYGPIVEALNQSLPETRIRLESSRDYAEFEHKLKRRQLDLALTNPYQTLVAVDHGYRVFAKIRGDEDFYGLILVRKDQDAPKRITDLRGKSLSCPSRTALASCMMPLLHLQEEGLDVPRDLKILSVGSPESSILNVARGLVDAGATWPPAWRAFQKEHPKLAGKLVVRWRTDPLPNNALIARHDIDPILIERIKLQLIEFNSTEKGRRLLEKAEIEGFEMADLEDYDKVRDFLRRYEEQLGGFPR